MKKEEIKDILYNVRNEFENEIDSYIDFYEDIDDNMFTFLDNYINKVNMLIDDYEKEGN